jgi:hypothetical protein
MSRRPIERPFTAFAVIVLPSGKMINALTLDTPIRPVAKNVNRLPSPYSHLLTSTTVPKGTPNGTYEARVAFFDPSEPIKTPDDAFLEASATLTIGSNP